MHFPSIPTIVTFPTMMRGYGGGGAPGPLSISGATITGLQGDGKAQIWTFVSASASITGATSVSYQWLADGLPISGAVASGFFVTDDLDGVSLSVQIEATDGVDSIEVATASAVIRYPAPQTLTAIPAITGTVGDVVSMPLNGHFNDLDPSSSTSGSLAYAVTSGALPGGLSIVAGVITGTLAAAVTAQAFTITASNSGGSVALSTTATVTAAASGNIFYRSDFQTPSEDLSRWVLSTPALDLAMLPERQGFGTYGSDGAMQWLPEAGLTSSATIRISLDISNDPVGTVYTVRAAVRAQAVSGAATCAVILRTYNASNGTVATPVNASQTVGTIIVTLADNEWTYTKANSSEVRLEFITTKNNASIINTYVHFLDFRTSANVATVPIVSSVNITSLGKIGEAQTADVQVTPAGTAVTLSWRVDGVAQGATYTPVAGDDGKALTVTATPTGGNPVTSAPVTITYVVPTFSVEPTLTPSTLTEGANLTWTVGTAGPGASVSYSLEASGVVVSSGSAGGTYTTNAPGLARLQVTANSSGGVASRTLTANVEAIAPPPDDGVTLVSTSFASDDRAIMDTPASWQHVPAATAPDDISAGAIQFGANIAPATIQREYLTRSAAPGDVFEFYGYPRIIGGNITIRTYVQFLNSADAVLAVKNSNQTGQITITTDPAPAGTTQVQVMFELRTGSTTALDGTRKYILHATALVNITASGPSPVFNGLNPTHISPYVYVGEDSVDVDFAGSFTSTGAITGMIYYGPEAHTWVSPTVLRITGSVEISPTEDRYVKALRGNLISHGAAKIPLRVFPAPAPLTLRADISVTPDFIEVNRPMTPFAPIDFVTGGVEPYTCSVIAKPAWVYAEDHNALFGGIAPSSPAAVSNLTVRVTDRLGAFVDVAMPITVVATRSRTPFATIAPTANLATAIGSNKGAGRVIQLQAGTYGMGNWFRFFEGTQENPMVIRGVGQTTIITGFSHDRCTGIIFENLKVQAASAPSQPADVGWPATSSILSANGSFCRYYDFWGEGAEAPISISPTSSWVTADTHTLVGTPFVSNRGNVFHNVRMNNVRAGMVVSDGCRQIGLYDFWVDGMRRDGITIGSAIGVLLWNFNTKDFRLNYTSGDHRDLLQAQPNNGATQYLTIKDCFFTGGEESIAGAQGGVQGLYLENDAFNTTGPTGKNPFDGRTHVRSNLKHRIRSSVFLSGSNYGAYFLGHVESKVDRTVAIGHPDQGGGSVPVFYNAGQAEVAVTNTLTQNGAWGGGGHNPDAYQGFWANLATMTTSAALVGSEVAIFPNWANTELTYDDPRDAVANGQPASAARFWINPASAWAVANPNVGPAWLRTGIA